MTSSRQAGPIELTERQLEVIRLIADGCSNQEVGAALGISPRTAKAHTDAVRQKLGVSRRRYIPSAYRMRTGRDPLSPGPGPTKLGLVG